MNGTMKHDESREMNDRDSLKLERLELALKASNEGIWDWWTDSQAIYYSRRILEFLECGKDHAPHLFLPPFESIHPDERRAVELTVAQALQRGGPETMAVDARVLTGGGDWRWLRIRGSVVRNRAGDACRIAGSMINISRRKQAEAQVEEERFLLRQLIDNIPVHVYFKDANSRFVMANRGMAQWAGFHDSAELVGKHDQDIFDEDHWKPAEMDELMIIRTGEPISDKLEHEIWPDRNETWVMTSKFPWRDRNGNIKGTFGISSDVSRIIRAQRQATELAEELQEKNETYEEELHLAREIQHAFTTRHYPRVSDSAHQLTFGSRYVPISGLAGDFFEIIPLRHDCAGILICDVMGHGVRSALVVAMLRGLLEKQRLLANDPGAFLHGLNDGLVAILERAGATMFATAFYGVIDLSAETFSYACAGHPGPILRDSVGVRQIATEREQRGPGLGLSRDSAYPCTTMSLDSMFRIILFTDGVLEAENQLGEPFFEKRLIELIAQHTSDPLDPLLEEILSSVLSFSQAKQFNDDVCLLGIEISPTVLTADV